LGLGRGFVLVAMSEVVASTAAPGLLPALPSIGGRLMETKGLISPSLTSVA
jgi:hypothetical protein